MTPLSTRRSVAGKTMLVTGANRGVGKALVEEALRRGAARVFAASRRPLAVTSDRLTHLTFDVTQPSEIARAIQTVDALDILVNNAGVAVADDLGRLDVVERHLQVNLLGMLRVTQACLPLLTRSRGAIVNHLSLAAVAALPMIPAYSISKAAALNMTQALRALLAPDAISVHGVVLGPVDTDMSRSLDVPKASPSAVAAGILDGMERGEEDIFPDPASAAIAQQWRAGVAKTLEQQFAAFVPDRAGVLA